MMKKYIAIIALVLPLVLFAIPAALYAKSTKASSPSPRPTRSPNFKLLQETRREELKLRIEEKLTEKREERNQNRINDETQIGTPSSKQIRIQEKKKELIRNYFSRLSIRMEAAIARLEKLIKRIENRVAIIKSENSGIDTALIDSEIIKAKDLLEHAKTELIAVNGIIEDTLTSNDPKTAFVVVRDSIKNVKNDLVEVHRILVHLIGDIKGLRVGNTQENIESVSSSPSPSVSSSPTSSPTQTPTTTPTATPTLMPTGTPTAAPTATP
ncbi:MAG TPA: hypothetical protein VJ399_03460 [Patescibacteria group bacterium]|nr:hypothetical protein [Patescibacteria group bacterium]